MKHCGRHHNSLRPCRHCSCDREDCHRCRHQYREIFMSWMNQKKMADDTEQNKLEEEKTRALEENPLLKAEITCLKEELSKLRT